MNVVAGGGRFDYSTVDRENHYGAGCASGARGGEVVYQITVGEPSIITAEIVNATYDTAMHLRAACDDAESEITCDDDGGSGTLSRISRAVEAGSYYLFVDGYSDRRGTGTVEIIVEPDDDTRLQVLRPQLPIASFEATTDHFLTRDFAPISIDGYSVDGVALFAVAYDRSVLDWETIWEVTEEAFTEWFQEQLDDGFGVVSFDSYSNEGGRFAGTSAEGAVGANQALALGLDEAGYAAEQVARRADGWHPTRCSVLRVANALRYDCLFEQSNVGEWTTHADLDAAAYGALFDAQVADGRFLRDLSVYPAANGAPRFHAVFDQGAPAFWTAAHGLDQSALEARQAELHRGDDARGLRFLRGYGDGEAPRFGAEWGP